jgi:hypothetical protein
MHFLHFTVIFFKFIKSIKFDNSKNHNLYNQQLMTFNFLKFSVKKKKI